MSNISVRVSEEVKVKLEEYRIKKGLHKKRLKLSHVTGQIVSKWLEKPTDLKEYIEAERLTKIIRTDNVTVSLNKTEKANLYKIFGEKYIDEVSSINLLVYIIIIQFLNENFEDFDIRKAL